MATQREVAERAGVSFITVSRVINGRGNVKKETRLRIERAIKELGYYPNSQGRALNSGRTAIIGVIAPVVSTRSLEGDLYFSGLLEGVELACRKHRYDMLLSTQRIIDRDFDYLRLFSQKKVDGTILFGDYMLSKEDTARIERERIPIVVVGDRPVSPAIGWVDTDNEKGGYQSALKLIGQGHRRIAFIGVNNRNANIADRLSGVRRACAEKGLPFLDKDLFTVDMGTDPGPGIIGELFAPGDRATAAVCGTDLIAIGLLNAARERSFHVPGDMSIIGFDGIQMIRYTNPPISSNRQPLSEMGFTAAEFLFRHIERPEASRKHKVFLLEEIKGQSVSPPRRHRPFS
ncbi:MAG: LacI family DNA-binding transcriptional regulator [Spirochaetia bacterium]|jgi:LacI family transcriptional regulator